MEIFYLHSRNQVGKKTSRSQKLQKKMHVIYYRVNEQKGPPQQNFIINVHIIRHFSWLMIIIMGRAKNVSTSWDSQSSQKYDEVCYRESIKKRAPSQVRLHLLCIVIFFQWWWWWAKPLIICEVWKTQRSCCCRQGGYPFPSLQISIHITHSFVWSPNSSKHAFQPRWVNLFSCHFHFIIYSKLIFHSGFGLTIRCRVYYIP